SYFREKRLWRPHCVVVVGGVLVPRRRIGESTLRGTQPALGWAWRARHGSSRQAFTHIVQSTFINVNSCVNAHVSCDTHRPKPSTSCGKHFAPVVWASPS